MLNMYKYMKNLIEHKYYKDKQTIMDRLNVFYANGALTEDQYMELVELTDKMYPNETTA